jgi:putative molybdopterin biosynthesis protein
VGERLLAAPLSRGAGVISSLTKADGLVILPRGVQGADAGDEVEVRLYRSKAELERSIFCIGSHDMTLDLLAQYLSQLDRRFISANVGSQAGLIALQRGEAHLAGSHLLNPKTGIYNTSYIQQFLEEIRVMIFGFVERDQGLIVRRGNPKGIKNLKDLITNSNQNKKGKEIRFINRQRGAGTRVLLDYELAKIGVPQTSIVGYDQEEFTHLGVAAAVASGRADCGLGIPAAAQSLDLDFIPLYHETYQLIIPKIYAESELLAPLFQVLKDSAFQKAVMHFPGYDIKNMGKLVGEI